MRRICVMIGAVVFATSLPLAVHAGDFHRNASLVCSDCHTMHFSQQHGTNADGSGLISPLGGAGPHPYLLRNEVNELCLGCHDNQSFAPDVYGPNANTYVRQAGALNEEGDGNEAQGHTLNSTAQAPGSNPAWSNADGLNCADCHGPHGRADYRNLRGATGSALTYVTGANDLTVWIRQAVASPMSDHYAFSNISFNEPDPTTSSYANFCKKCHTDFHGVKGGAEVGGATGEEWLRHPNADANIGALGGGHSSLTVFTGRANKVQVMSQSGVIPSADNSPSCMSCHKGHGNQNAFGLIFMTGTGTIDEEGDDGTSFRGTCKQCHVQGG